MLVQLKAVFLTP